MSYPTKKLGDVCEVVGGGTPSTGIRTYWDGEIVWVTPKDLGQLSSKEIGDTVKKITQQGVDNSSAKLLPVGSVILSSRAPIGYLAINTVPTATNQGCRSFICGDKIFNKYLYYFLIKSRDYLQTLGSGSTFLEVSGSRLKEIEIPLPPIAEQRRIVEKIEKQFAKIDEAARLRAESISATDQLLPAALHEIFSTAESKGWALVSVGDLCEIKGGKRLPKGHVLTNTPTAHPYIRVADFVPYGIDQRNIKYVDEETFESVSRYTIGKSDVFISIAGTIGVTGVIPEYLDGANLTENAAKLTNLKGIEQRYLMYMLTSEDAVRQMTADSIQTTIAKLGLFRIARLKIPLPPLAEQKKIVKKLDALFEKVRALRELQLAQSADLKALKQSILHEAFQRQ